MENYQLKNWRNARKREGENYAFGIGIIIQHEGKAICWEYSLRIRNQNWDSIKRTIKIK